MIETLADLSSLLSATALAGVARFSLIFRSAIGVMRS